MKQKFEDILTRAGSEYSLSEAEKMRMQRVLKQYMNFKPLRGAESYSSVSLSYRWYSFTYRPVAAALVLVLVFGSGVSYAAEGALPGDTLYSVKTMVNEPVRVAIATNAEAKAELQIELAERRIEEAAVLAVEGRLDEDTQESLAVAFESHAEAASEQIKKAEADDEGSSIELASRFETRLVAHENVLAEVEVNTTEEAEAPKSHRLSDALRTKAMALSEARFNRSRFAAANVSAEMQADVALMATSADDAGTEPAQMTMSLAIAPEPAADVSATNARSAKMTAPPAEEPAPAPDARTISRMKSAAEKALKTAQKNLRNAKSLSSEARARAEADERRLRRHALDPHRRWRRARARGREPRGRLGPRDGCARVGSSGQSCFGYRARSSRRTSA